MQWSNKKHKTAMVHKSLHNR